MIKLLSILFLFVLCSCASKKPAPIESIASLLPTESVPIHRFDRVIHIIMENSDFQESLKDPYLNEIAKKGTLFTNFHAISHPSYPNYLAMVAGETFSIPGDDQITIDARSVGDLLDDKKLSWRNYADDYPGHCFLGNRHKRYARKHVPFISFKNVQSDPKECAKMGSSLDFQSDWSNGQLSEYSFFTPDLDHDGHDTGVKISVKWLKPFLNALLEDTEKMKGTLIVLTYDEAGREPTNQIYTVFFGPMVKSNFEYSRFTNHYDVLRTIEDNFSLGTLGKKDASAHPIDGIWK